jgi:hypothetical protein
VDMVVAFEALPGTATGLEDEGMHLLEVDMCSGEAAPTLGAAAPVPAGLVVALGCVAEQWSQARIWHSER